MKKSNAWWLVGLVLVAVVIVVGLLVFGDDDEADPTAATDPTPTAAASQPVTAPETTGTPVPGAPTPSTKTPTPKSPTASKPSLPSAPSPSKPVSLKATAPIDAGATAQITAIKPVTSKAVGPGEISGPALQVTMRIAAGSKSVDLSDVVVNGYYGKDREPAVPVAKPGGKPFTGVLKGGEEATGVYVFNVPEKARQRVTIELFFAAAKAPVLFAGSAS